MNPEIENALENNDVEDGLDEYIDIADSDEDSDVEQDESDDEYFEEIYSEILEAVNRNAENLQLLQKTFNSLKLGLLERMWYCRIFKEIEMANDTVEQVEEKLFEFSD